MQNTPPLKVKPDIVDVRTAHVEEGSLDAHDQVIAGLTKPAGQKSLPTLLLYDERGLQLYERLTSECFEYYLFAAEEQILEDNADEIVKSMLAPGGRGVAGVRPVILELGAGSLRKTSHILLALSRQVPNTSPQCDAASSPTENNGLITYYALDLEKPELDRTLKGVWDEFGDQLQGKIDAKGMWGTYDDGMKFVEDGGLMRHRRPSDLFGFADESSDGERGRVEVREHVQRDLSPVSSGSESVSDMSPSNHSSSDDGGDAPLHILFLGSSLGNFNRAGSVAFLKDLPLRPGSSDTLLIGLDHNNSKDAIELAYNDPRGITRDFMLNALKGAGRALGNEELLAEGQWEYVGKYNETERRHEGYFKSVNEQDLEIPSAQSKVHFKKDELIHVEYSYKYSDADAYALFADAELRPIMRWTDENDQYSVWLLERPAFVFPLTKNPSSSESWTLTSPHSQSIPSLHDWDVMWKAWDTITVGMIPRSMLHVKPIDLRHICLFYLGHIPAFLDIHLSRLLKEPFTEPEYFPRIFERGIDPHVDDPTQCHPHSEVPQKEEDWPCLEELLTYRDNVRERVRKLYASLFSGERKLNQKIARVLFMNLEHEGFHAETLLYMLLQKAGEPGGTIPPAGFAAPNWDVLAEQWSKAPQPTTPTVTLGPAKVTIGHDDPEAHDEEITDEKQVLAHELGWDNEHPARTCDVGQFKIEWRPVSNGQFYEFYEKRKGTKGAVSFPASWIEVGGKVQVRTLFGPVPLHVAYQWPVLTTYDDLSTYAQVKGGRIPTEPELRLFFDNFKSGYGGGENIGFRNWHLVPPTMGGEKDGGKGHNGGAWEWTSTMWDKYDGFVPSKLYPGYSADFFDGKHYAVIGGSYVTIPRMAERRSLRNWYQHNYPYAWVTARVAYDA